MFHLCSRLARYGILAALMISIGVPWAALQSVAWVGMAVTYSLETGSLSQGLSDTFDGEHPCPLCKAVAQGTNQDSEKKTPQDSRGTSGKKKVELLMTVMLRFDVRRPSALPHEETVIAKLISRSAEPDVPPPRVA